MQPGTPFFGHASCFVFLSLLDVVSKRKPDKGMAGTSALGITISELGMLLHGFVFFFYVFLFFFLFLRFILLSLIILAASLLNFARCFAIFIR